MFTDSAPPKFLASRFKRGSGGGGDGMGIERIFRLFDFRRYREVVCFTGVLFLLRSRYDDIIIIIFFLSPSISKF